MGDPGPEVRKSGKRRRCRGLLTGGVGAIGVLSVILSKKGQAKFLYEM